jgi:hypothetical protein
MSKDQISALVSAAIAFVIAVLAVFGYNVMVVQPQIDALLSLATACP